MSWLSGSSRSIVGARLLVWVVCLTLAIGVVWQWEAKAQNAPPADPAPAAVDNAPPAENADTDPMFSEEQANIAAELYLQGFDPEHPLASPLFAPVEGYPPSLISVGTGEVLRDDSLRFHEKLLAAGVRSRLSAIDGMEHVAVVRSPDLTGSAETFDEIVRFIDARLSA